MRITKLEVHNFGPYKGTFEFNFKRNGSRNIEIIWGTNGAGKTHIFKAIKWCLYGYDPSPKDINSRQGNRKDAWDCIYGTNKDGAPPQDAHMHVYLWFENKLVDEVQSYLLKRSTFPKSDRVLNYQQIEVEAELRRNAQKIEPEKITETIESILPVSASQFFMFHGEDLRYMSQEHLTHTKNAIELILEANTFRVGIQDLKKINAELEDEHDEEVAKIEGLAQLVNSKDHFSKKIILDEQELTTQKKELDQTKQKIEELEGELRTRERSKASMARLDDLRKQKSQLLDEEKKLIIRNDGLVNQLAPFMILPELKKVLDDKHSHHLSIVEDNKKIQQLQGRLELAEEIEKLQQCICGHDITNVEKNFIIGQKETITKRIRNIQNHMLEEDPSYHSLNLTVNRIESNNLDFETLFKDIADLRIRKDEIDSAITIVERQLSGIEEEKIRELNFSRDDLIRKKGEIEEKIRTIENRKKESENNRDRCIRLIQQREKYYSLSTSIEKQQKMAKACESAFSYVLSQLSILRKSQIMECSTKYFNRLTNKPEEYTRIDIDDDYNVRVVDSKGNIVLRSGLSTAEREIVALSFILGLKTASEKTAPLILDTFFVHLDESHYANIVKEMPTFADQTILILTDLEYKNLQERAPESFLESVNHIWQINRLKNEERSEAILQREGDNA